MEYGRSLARSQDDEQVNYFCQRPHNDNDFAYHKGHRWALGDDSVIDVSVASLFVDLQIIVMHVFLIYFNSIC